MTEERRTAILMAIDMCEWKHSWHLKCDEYGGKIIDETLIPVIEKMIKFRLEQVMQLLEARGLLTETSNVGITKQLMELLKCSTISLASVELVVSGTEILGVQVKDPMR